MESILGRINCSNVTVRISCPSSVPRPVSWQKALTGMLGAFAAVFLVCAQTQARPSHAIAMHGEPALPEGFTHLPYANPDAPKGGRLVQGVLGTFDSLNPFIVKGLAPQAGRASVINGYVVEPLMARGFDEPFTLYGLLARSIETDEKRSFVTFTLDPAARFSDRVPVAPQDVLFSWQ